MIAQLGPLVTAVAGSMQGTTFQRHPVGTLIRKRPLPTLRRSNYTSDRRTNWQMLLRTWRTLTSTERTDWQTAADALTWYNRFGTVIPGRGFWLFMQANSYATLASASPVTVVGAIAPVGAIVGLSSSSNVAMGTMYLDWSSGNVPATDLWYVFATRPLTGSITYPGSAFRFLRTIPDGTATSFNVGGEYLARFGALPTTTQNVYVEIRPTLQDWYLPGATARTLNTPS